ncbi:hypothetical protein [Clostridium hydrogeniformans]|uniref:hypothetical protein n=1 Tax=Clostridium hydrogeniformans TaxID=349933 RepID=UPI00047F341F|nr:hypothetical protein [Clostridium hydrogeniformans]
MGSIVSKYITVITILLCIFAIVRIVIKVNCLRREEEGEEKNNKNIALIYVLFIEILCLIVSFINLFFWKNIIISISLLILSLAMQYDKIIYILCHDENKL